MLDAVMSSLPVGSRRISLSSNSQTKAARKKLKYTKEKSIYIGHNIARANLNRIVTNTLAASQ